MVIIALWKIAENKEDFNKLLLQGMHIADDCGDDVRRKTFSLKVTRKAPSPDARLEAFKRLQLLLSFFAGNLCFRRICKEAGKGLVDDVPADTPAPQFLLDPASSETAQPNAASRPESRELPVVHISQPIKPGQNRLNDSRGKLFFGQFPFYFRTASRTEREIAVRGIPGSA